MPSFGGYAGALGAGIAEGFDPAYDNAVKRGGQMLLANALQGLGPQIGGPIQGPVGGGQPPMGGGMPLPQPPPQGGMPPQPQGSPQGSVPPQGGMPPQMPQRPMGGPPVGAPPQGGGQMQPQGGQGFAGGQQQQGPLDWRQLIQAIMRTNPGAPPQLIFSAVNQAIPLMNSQAQIEWKNYIAPQLAQQRMGVTERGQDIAADVRTRGQDVSAETARRGQDVRAETAAGAQETTRRGQDIRAETAKEGQQEHKREFNIREARIAAHQSVTADQRWQQLDQQRKAAEARIKQGGDRQALSQWRAILDAQHKRAMEIIQGWSANNALPPEVRKQLLKDADEAYQKAIKELKPPSTFSDRFTGGG